MTEQIIYPGDKKFAFTILDDTDSATLENVEPVYRYLNEIGMRTTKTVWPLPYEDHLNSAFMYSATLDDELYLEFVRWLKSAGFEVTWHGATMESSVRSDVIRGLEVFKEKLGRYPDLHVNHAANADNLYWGLARFDSRLIKILLKLMGYKKDEFCGEVPGEKFFWADYAQKYIKYCRSFSYTNLNSLSNNPSMPYQDENRPAIKYWFSTAYADNVIDFEKRVTKKNINKLVAENGICILSTHLGKGYSKNGELRDSVKKILDYIVAQNGWFVPVGEILDWRLAQGFGQKTSCSEKHDLERQWFKEKVFNKLLSKRKKIPWWEY